MIGTVKLAGGKPLSSFWLGEAEAHHEKKGVFYPQKGGGRRVQGGKKQIGAGEPSEKGIHVTSCRCRMGEYERVLG